MIDLRLLAYDWPKFANFGLSRRLIVPTRRDATRLKRSDWAQMNATGRLTSLEQRDWQSGRVASGRVVSGRVGRA